MAGDESRGVRIAMKKCAVFRADLRFWHRRTFSNAFALA
jgi:hypothetical protein